MKALSGRSEMVCTGWNIKRCCAMIGMYSKTHIGMKGENHVRKVFQIE